METEWTPIPGNKLGDEQARDWIARFRARYRIHTESRPAVIPTWVTFPAGQNVEETILSEPPIADYETLFFHIENRQEVYAASPREIAGYFEQRNPWETNWDYYVFDASLNWAIVFTHELAYGPATILVGDLP